MKFIYGKSDWRSLNRGQENCYLLTNGLGGYSSMTMIGSVTRNDHALFMACTQAPNHRYHIITRMDEFLVLGTREILLSSQEYVNRTKNQEGYIHLNQFCFDDFPSWYYQAEGVEIRKTIVLRHGENTLGICYEVHNRGKEAARLILIPQLQFTPKGEHITKNQPFITTAESNTGNGIVGNGISSNGRITSDESITGNGRITSDESITGNGRITSSGNITSCGSITSNGMILFYTADASVEQYETGYQEDLYFEYDARDGRDAVGITAHNHRLSVTVPAGLSHTCDLIYSLKPINGLTFDRIEEEEISRLRALELQSAITDQVGLQLVKSADQFIVDRASTGGKSIMAGYPFFADWGRDTMIAMVGCCISTRRYEEAKSIFRTFMKYCHKGLMPNMFPEGENDPIYNTVDAALLFIGAVYEYYEESKDMEFLEEAFPVMEDIISWYRKGTDYHIRMEEDGLITAGSGFEQVTWMDVRFGDILPTPRHGKPVEINAYWYNDLMILNYTAGLLGKADATGYRQLADKVKESFGRQFWNDKKGCLKDLVSGEPADEQIRCNQIWAVSLSYTMLSREQERLVVDKVFEKLYTPYGLRTLDKEDKAFKPRYGGSHYNRDIAYHQGTVWPFPVGGYYLAYLKVHDYSKEAARTVKEQLEVMEAVLREGCIGQIAEIYDGETPTISRGCFAQAWSVSEILRVYAKLEK